MKLFKFLRSPIITAHDGGDIYVDQVFYIMNKEERLGFKGRPIEKYRIVQRIVRKKYEDMYKPDYDNFWYFRTKQNALYLKGIWERQDRITNGGEIFNNQSDITITFNR